MRDKILAIIRENITTEGLELTDDLQLTTAAGINSFEFISAIAALEEAFGIEIPDNVLASFRSIGDVVRYIEEKA